MSGWPRGWIEWCGCTKGCSADATNWRAARSPAMSPETPPEANRKMPLLGAAAVVLLLVGAGTYGCSKRNNDKLSDTQVSGQNSAATTARVDPAKRCASTQTYELLKRELFRRAAQIRGNADPALFDRIATAAALRIERPVVTSRDEGLGSIACRASATVDLPPGLAVAGSRTSLSADLAFTLQPAADGSGDVLMFTNADAITVPLATIGRQAGVTQPNPMNPSYDGPGEVSPAPSVVRPAPPPPPATSIPAPVPPRPPAAPVAAAASGANPSFPCARARTSGEVAICRDPALAQLDRRMAAQYRSAYDAASPRERDILRSTAHRFYGYRDNCPDARCIANGYRGRMREIDDIMRADGLDDKL